MWERNFADNNIEARGVFFDLIMQNIAFLGPSSQALIPEIYAATLDMMEFESGNPEYTHAPHEYNAAMISFTEKVLAESKALSKSLHMPCLCKSYEDRLSAFRMSGQEVTQEHC